MNTGSFVRPGQQIGQFEVAALVSRGNRFDVFAGIHKQFGWSVALKVLHLAYVQDGSLVKRVHHHMAVIADLLNPNVAMTYEVGLTSAGQPYSAMAFVEGGSLDATITELRQQGSPVSVDYALSLCRGIADGLATLHKLGIVHYALSPQHVLIRGDGTPVLIGLTPHYDADSDAVEGDTVVGPFDYRAPETVAGKAIDERSNIFSLGVMLYAILTADQAEGLGTAEKTGQMLPLREVREDLSAETYLVVDRCLNSQASERFQTMGEVVTAIDRAITGAEQPDGIEYGYELVLIGQSAQRRSLFLVLLAVVVVLGIGMAYRLFGPKNEVTGNEPEQPAVKSVRSLLTPAEDISIIKVLAPADDARYEVDERLSFRWCWPVPLRPEEQFIIYLKSDRQEVKLEYDTGHTDDKCYEFAAVGYEVVDFPGTYSWQIRLHSTISDAILDESEFRDIDLLRDGSLNTPTHTPSATATFTRMPTRTATATATSTTRPSRTATATATETPSITPLQPTFTPTATPVPPTFPPPPTPRPISPPPTSPPPPPTPTAPLPPQPTPTAPLPPQPTATPPLRNSTLTSL